MFIHYSRVYQGVDGKGSPVVQELISSNKLQSQRLVVTKRSLLRSIFGKSINTYILHFGGIHVLFLLLILNVSKHNTKLVYHGTDLHSWPQRSLIIRIKTLINKWASVLSTYMVNEIYVVSPSLLKHIPISRLLYTQPIQLGVRGEGNNGVQSFMKEAAFVDNNNSEVKNHKLALSYAKLIGMNLNVLSGLKHKDFLISLSNSKALIITSFAEGSPTVLREALMLGITVYTVNVGDCWNWIERFGGYKLSYNLDTPVKLNRNNNFTNQYLNWESSKPLFL